MATKKQLEKEYGIKIVDDSYYNPYSGRMVKQYRIYSADGCQWENGLKTLDAVRKECEEWATHLKAIKRTELTRKEMSRV